MRPRSRTPRADLLGGAGLPAERRFGWPPDPATSWSVLSNDEIAFAAASYVGLIGVGGTSDILAIGPTFANGDMNDMLYVSEIPALRLRARKRSLVALEILTFDAVQVARSFGVRRDLL